MDDILSCIFNYIQLKDIVNCFPVCKQFNKAVNNNFYWKPIIKKDFNYISPFCNDHKNKYKLYCLYNRFSTKCLELNNPQNKPATKKCLDYKIYVAIENNILDLNYFYFNRLPAEIGLLTNLRNMYLDNNYINKLPAEIGLLTNLRNLSLANTDLPIEFTQLTNLESIKLGHTKSNSYSELNKLPNLKQIWISDKHNDLIPENLWHLCCKKAN